MKLVTFLRTLRKHLSGKVIKTGEATYLIEDCVKVSVNFYCRLKTEQDCRPYSISVGISPETTGIRSAYKVFRTRTIQKRKDGSFNFDSMKVAITKCIKAIQDRRQEIEDHEKKREQDKKEKTKALKKLESKLPKAGRQNTRNGFSYELEGGIIVQIRMYQSGSGSISYDIDCEGIDDLSSAVDLVKKMKEAQV